MSSAAIARRSLNYLPALGVTAVYVVLAEGFGLDPIAGANAGTKGAACQTLAGIGVGVLGLGFVAFSIMFGVSARSRLALMIGHGGRTLRYWLTGSFMALGVSTIGFAVLLPIDHTDRPSGARYVAAFFLALVTTALVELVWLAHRTFGILSRQAQDEMSTSGDGGWEVQEVDAAGHEVPNVQLGKSRRSA